MKKIIVLLLSILISVGVFIMPSSKANAQEIDVTTINAGNNGQQSTKSTAKDYKTVYVDIYFYSSGREWNYSFPYSDDWFKEDDGHYNHQLCRGSMGLTVAAFRLMNLPLGSQDCSLIQYYKDTGFSDIETYNYENAPTDYSISNGIANKKIDDFTLLAVGVCGSGYKDEWCSNLTIQQDIRHYGFDSAAKQVEQRIDDYIKKYNITGNIKVWLTGFSRASAVSNLVAADLTDSGKYAGVFGYHFAVPNNTTEVKEYDNIYCIVGKNDPVPFVALEEWGYTKFGTVLYTPSKETDSRFNVKLMKASMVYEDMTGEALIVSPQINKSLRLILLNLLDMIPDRSVYTNDLQTNVIQAWHAKSNTNDLITLAAGLLNELGNAKVSIQEKASQLAEYILNLGVELTTKNPNSSFYADLYENFNLSANLVREHQPMVYIAWLFSDDDPGRIYSENLDFTRLFIYGDVKVGVFDDQGLIETIENGQIKRSVPAGSTTKISSNNNFLYSKKEGNRLEIIIPKDQNYLIQVDSKDGKFSYEGVTFTGRKLSGKQIDTTNITIADNSSYFILSRASNSTSSTFAGLEDCELIESNNYASPTVLLAMENSNIFHLTFDQMKQFGIINIVLLGLFALFIVVRVIRVKALKKKASRFVTFCINLSISFIFILLYEQANIYFDTIPMVRTILGILTLISILHLCYTSMKPINRRLSRFFLVAIIFVALGNAAKQYFAVDISTIIYILACLIITYGIISERKPGKKLFFIASIVSIILSFIASYFTDEFHPWMIVYIFVITMMNVAAEHLDHRLRMLIGAFMLPSCLSVWESYTGGNVKIHTFLVFAYSICLLLMVGYVLIKSYRLEKTYEKKVTTS